jgi:hypothetical protein
LKYVRVSFLSFVHHFVCLVGQATLARYIGQTKKASKGHRLTIIQTPVVPSCILLLDAKANKDVLFAVFVEMIDFSVYSRMNDEYIFFTPVCPIVSIIQLKL